MVTSRVTATATLPSRSRAVMLTVSVAGSGPMGVISRFGNGKEIVTTPPTLETMVTGTVVVPIRTTMDERSTPGHRWVFAAVPGMVSQGVNVAPGAGLVMVIVGGVPSGRNVGVALALTGAVWSEGAGAVFVTVEPA